MIDRIWAKDQEGEEVAWQVEQELDKMYEVFHKYIVTHIDKSLVYKMISNGRERWMYPKVLPIPEDADKPVTDYYVWTVGSN